MEKGHYYLASYDVMDNKVLILALEILEYNTGGVRADVIYDSDSSVASWTGMKNKLIFVHNIKEVNPDMLLIEKCKLEMKKNGKGE